VYTLDLRGVGMQGSLPREMSFLRDVTYLDISTNDLEGDISDVVGGWTHLQKLKMSANKFQTFPSSLTQWKELTHFDISSNGIEGPIPETLSQATQLVYVDIAVNDFNGTIPAELGEMPFLETLYMHSNSIQGTVPSSLCDRRGSGELAHLTVNCRLPTPEVECSDECCTACNDYDTDRNPFD